MKRKLLLISCFANLVFIFLLIVGFKNGDTSKSAKKYFFAEYTTGKMWNHDLGFSQQTDAMVHSRFLSSLRKKGVIELGARYADKGVIVFTAEDLQSATSLMKSDTAITHQLFDVEVNEVSFFYEGCIRKN